jgi:NADH pyrophosphatase NudC (nudix superfamily)
MKTYIVNLNTQLRIKAKNQKEVKEIIKSSNNPHQTKQKILIKEINTFCNHCGKEMQDKTQRAKYCSSACRSAVHYAKNRTKPKRTTYKIKYENLLKQFKEQTIENT